MENPVQNTKTTELIEDSLQRSSRRRGFLLIALAFGLAWFALSPRARAVCRDGCDSLGDPYDGNTFLGEDALANDTTGNANTAIGFNALISNTTGWANTAMGEAALATNSSGSENVAIGESALYNNSTGGSNTAIGYFAHLYGDGIYENTAVGSYALGYFTSGDNNTAVGAGALLGDENNGSTGSNNTATGYSALSADTSGTDNTANGYQALYFNTTGNKNVAVGRGALYNNTTASNNIAVGYQALNKNKTGTSSTATGYQTLKNATGAGSNTADGYQVLNATTTGIYNTGSGVQALLKNTTGFGNTALGVFALLNNTTGYDNIALGINAGSSLTTGIYNIDIGNSGVTAEANTMRLGTSGQQTNTYIAGISGVTVAGGIGVIVDSNGHLGTTTSSARFKEKIQPMDKASEAILSLEPVTFRYKHDLDPKGIPQFGLVAEQVEKVNPDLVVRDEKGKPYSVRYEAVNAMLLNEFLKEHRTVQELKSIAATQEATIARQQKQIEALTMGLQKVSDELAEASPSHGGLELKKSPQDDFAVADLFREQSSVTSKTHQ